MRTGTRFSLSWHKINTQFVSRISRHGEDVYIFPYSSSVHEFVFSQACPTFFHFYVFLTYLLKIETIPKYREGMEGEILSYTRRIFKNKTEVLPFPVGT